MKVKSEMKRRCHRCGTALRPLKMRCPYCRESAMSWLHIILIFAAFAVTTIFYVLKVM